jgi:hypothetical protein
MIEPAETTIRVSGKQWPPVRCEIRETNEPWTLSFYFAHIGEAPAFLGFEVLLDTDHALGNVIDTDGAAGIDVGAFPRLFRSFPMYLEYARSEVARKYDRRDEYLEALRDVGKTRRGLPDRFYREIANQYNELVAAGKPHPIKTIAELHAPVDKSRASRWVKEARARGYITNGGDQ